MKSPKPKYCIYYYDVFIDSSAYLNSIKQKMDPCSTSYFQVINIPSSILYKINNTL